jgi:hypothetical protein
LYERISSSNLLQEKKNIPNIFYHITVVDIMPTESTLVALFKKHERESNLQQGPGLLRRSDSSERDWIATH